MVSKVVIICQVEITAHGDTVSKDSLRTIFTKLLVTHKSIVMRSELSCRFCSILAGLSELYQRATGNT